MITAKVTEFDTKSNKLICKHTKNRNAYFFERKNVKIKRCRKGICVGDPVNVYVINDDNFSLYYVAVEEIENC